MTYYKFSGKELESNIDKATESGANYLLSLDPDIARRGKVSIRSCIDKVY